MQTRRNGAADTYLPRACLPQWGLSQLGHITFLQVEALYADENVSFADLRQVLPLLTILGPDAKIRLRPLLPLYRAFCRDGYFVQYMRWQGV